MGKTHSVEVGVQTATEVVGHANAESQDKLEIPPIECLLGKILLKLDQQDDRIPGSLIIKPEYSVEKPWSGVVVALGPGRYNSAGKFEAVYDVLVGDRVIVNRYSGYTVKVKNNPYQLMDYRDILTVIAKGVIVE